MMTDDIYVQLRERMDTLGIGFPDVPGVAIPYLKKFFTEEYALVYLAMENKFQLAQEIADRLGRREDETIQALEEMAAKGLVFTTTDTNPTFYAPWPWLTGWGDWTAYYEDQEAAVLEGRYKLSTAPRIGTEFMQRSIFRTVPIHETIPNRDTVAPYDDIRQLLENAGTISVADCYCDRHFQLRGDSVYSPLERCFLFGKYAEYLVDKGFGRRVSVDEAMAILDKCKELGMTQNITDMRNPVFLCNCADRCLNLARREVPGSFLEYERTSNYFAVVDGDLCTGCGECVDRCWVKATAVAAEGIAEVNQQVCVGCGVCVIKCPAEAISLREIPKAEHYTPAMTHRNVRSNEEYDEDLKAYGRP
jgi:Na+-translocating ferredoxin:NAD+ oxidoreductase subunit B